MNMVEKLMKLDKGDLKIPSKECKIKLAKLKDEEVVFECKAIDPERISEIQEQCLEYIEGGAQLVNTFKSTALMIIDSCPDIFKNAELQKHFNAPTSIELMKTLMLSGEIAELYEVVQEVNGSFTGLKKKKKLRN